MTFAFEKLDIYQKSIDFVRDIRAFCKKTKTDYDILDQLKRAALSVSLNVAEGSGRWHKGEKKHFYYIARGSLYECIPILQILLSEELVTQNQYNDLYEKAENLAMMLTKLIQSINS